VLPFANCGPGPAAGTEHSTGDYRNVALPFERLGRVWTSYIVRHEMIHRLQVQELGVIRMYREPEWFVEGMAYSLSGDPRSPLAEPFETFRSRFASWNIVRGKEKLWEQVRKL
jgi:hypothetical protein